MRLVIVRHAEAAPGRPDEQRPLTARGHELARELGRVLRDEVGVPDAVLSSPLLRALETAADLGFGEAQAEELLAPGACADDVLRAVEGHGELVVVVGHQPDCGRVAAALGDGEEPPFPPGGWALVELR